MSVDQLIFKLKSNGTFTEKLQIALSINQNKLIPDKSLLLDWIFTTLQKQKVAWENQELLDLLCELLEKYPRNIMTLLMKNELECERKRILYGLSLKTQDQILDFLKILVANIKKEYLDLIDDVIKSLEFNYSRKTFGTCLDIIENCLPLLHDNSDDESRNLIENLFDLIVTRVVFSTANMKELPLIIAAPASKSYQVRFLQLLKMEKSWCKLVYMLDQYFQSLIEEKMEILSGVLLFRYMVQVVMVSTDSTKGLKSLDLVHDLLLVVQLYNPSGIDLKEIYTTLINHLASESPTESFRCIKLITLLDFNSVYDNINPLLKVLLQPSSVELKEAEELMIIIMDMYVKARKASDLFKLLIDTVLENEWTNDPSILSSPEFLSRFELHIASMHISQSFEMLELFQTFLIENFTKAVDSSKKRKKNKIPSANLVSTLFIHAIRNFKLQESRKSSFEDLLGRVYVEFISNIIDHVDKTQTYYERLVVPTLQINYILIQASSEYFEKFASCKQLCQMYDKLEGFENEDCGVLLLETGCLCLQILNESKKKDDHLSDLQTKLWNSKLSADLKNLVTARNLAVLCNNADADSISEFVNTLIKSVLKSKKVVYEFLLKDSNFYEIEQVQKILLKVIFSRLGSFVKKDAPVLGKILKNFDQNESFKAVIAYEGENVTKRSSWEGIFALLHMLEMFPAQYFTKKDQENIQWLMFGLEKMMVVSEQMSLHSHRSKLRSLVLKYAISRSDCILTLYHDDVLKWYVDSVNGDSQVQLLSTVRLYYQTISKVLQHYDSKRLVKGGTVKGESYLKSIFKHMKKLDRNDLVIFKVAFFRAVNEFMRDRGKNVPNLAFADTFAKYAKKFINKFDKTNACDDEMYLLVEVTEYLQTLDSAVDASSLLIQKFANDAQVCITAIKILIQKAKAKVPPNEVYQWFLKLWKSDTNLDSIIYGYVKKCTLEEYSVTFDLHLRHIDQIILDLQNGQTLENETIHVGCLKSILVLLEASVICDGFSKTELAGRINTLLAKLYPIIVFSPSIGYVIESFKIGIFIGKSRMFDHNVSQTSLVLSLATAIEANNTVKGDLTIFDHIYQLLNSIVRFKREELLNLIPIYLGNISSLIACFIDTQQFKVNKLYTPMPIKCLQNIKPIPGEYRRNVTRLIEQLTVKTSDTVDLIKPFTKHIPYLISKLLVSGNVNEWKQCLFLCLDCCDQFGRNMLLAQVDVGTREIYKRIVSEWENEHRYSGKA